MNAGPIIVIDDDADDKEIFESALKELAIENRRRWFTNCKDAFDYLRTINEQPFIIFCDVNIPGLAGIEFKRQIRVPYPVGLLWPHPRLCSPISYFYTWQ